MPMPKKNVAYAFNVALVDATNRPQFKTNPTISAGDFKVSIDGSALTNLVSLPTIENSTVKVSLSSSEMNGDRVLVVGHRTDGEWDDVDIYIDTSLVTVDDLTRASTPANLVNVDASGRILSNVAQIAGSSTAATLMSTSANTIIVGTVDASPSPSTTQLSDATNLTSTVNNFYTGRIVIFTSGNLRYQAAQIQSYIGATHTLILTALTGAPVAGDTYVML